MRPDKPTHCGMLVTHNQLLIAHMEGAGECRTHNPQITPEHEPHSFIFKTLESLVRQGSLGKGARAVVVDTTIDPHQPAEKYGSGLIIPQLLINQKFAIEVVNPSTAWAAFINTYPNNAGQRSFDRPGPYVLVQIALNSEYISLDACVVDGGTVTEYRGRIGTFPHSPVFDMAAGLSGLIQNQAGTLPVAVCLPAYEYQFSPELIRGLQEQVDDMWQHVAVYTNPLGALIGALLLAQSRGRV